LGKPDLDKTSGSGWGERRPPDFRRGIAVRLDDVHVIVEAAGHVAEHADGDPIGVRDLRDGAPDVSRQGIVQADQAGVDELQQHGPGESLRDAADAHVAVRRHRPSGPEVGQPEAPVPDAPVGEPHADGDAGRVRALPLPFPDDGHQGAVGMLAHGLVAARRQSGQRASRKGGARDARGETTT
jgi:hypothetical protein